jgi:hypothetical protein
MIKHIISLIWWRVNTLHSTPIMCDSHTTIMNGVHKHIGYMSPKEWKKEMVTGRCYFPVIFDANCHSWFCDWMRRSTVVAVGVLRLVFDLHIFLYIALLCISRVSCPSIPLLRGLIIPAFQRGRSKHLKGLRDQIRKRCDLDHQRRKSACHMGAYALSNLRWSKMI